MAKSWKQRQIDRIRSGKLMSVPWWTQDWARRGETEFHYPHVAKRDKELLSYTKDKDQGERGVVTTVKPGRYLKRYFGDTLTHDEIADWSNKFKIHAVSRDIKFAMTRDEIRQVYEKGPCSCMSGSRNRVGYDGTSHPVEAYAAGDLAIAYVEDSGRITARCLCWPEKKTYLTSVYGNFDRLVTELKKLGFTGTRNFDGAKLLKIKHHSKKHECLFPHIDADRRIDVKDEYVVFSSKGKHSAGSGWINLGPMCTLCSRYRATIKFEGADICNVCYTNRKILCYVCGHNRLSVGSMYRTTKNRQICLGCIQKAGLKQCSNCNTHKKRMYKHLRNDRYMCLMCVTRMKNRGYLFLTKCKQYKTRDQNGCRCKICDLIYHKKQQKRKRKRAVEKAQLTSTLAPRPTDQWININTTTSNSLDPTFNAWDSTNTFKKT